MSYYVGLDVSLQETFVSIINKEGKIIREKAVLSTVEELSNYLLEQELSYEKIGIESGQLSIYLCKGLRGERIACIMC